MKLLKKGQIVYFYRVTGPFMGEIVTGKITSATKDLLTCSVTYEVETSLAWPWGGKVTVKAENLYTNPKVIEKEYKEELIYNALKKKLDDLNTLLNKILVECKDKSDDNKLSLHTISLDNIAYTTQISAHDLLVNDRNILKEIDALKKDVADIKKKIKPKTKKPVIKEEKK